MWHLQTIPAASTIPPCQAAAREHTQLQHLGALSSRTEILRIQGGAEELCCLHRGSSIWSCAVLDNDFPLRSDQGSNHSSAASTAAGYEGEGAIGKASCPNPSHSRVLCSLHSLCQQRTSAATSSTSFKPVSIKYSIDITIGC